MSAKVPLESVLIVGGSGFLGHHIALQLRERHPTTHVSSLDLNPPRNPVPGVSHYPGDITDPSSIDSILSKLRPQCIIHTASPSPNQPRASAEKLYIKVNLEGTRNLLSAAEKFGVKAFVYTSSASIVFSGTTDVSNANESAPVPSRGLSAYTETKAVGESLVLSSDATTTSMATCALRISGIFGEHDTQMVPNMLYLRHSLLCRIQFGLNRSLFDFTYVGNAASAHILAAEHLLSIAPGSSADRQAFFITNGEPLPFYTMLRMVWGLKDGCDWERKWVVVVPWFWLGLVIAGAVQTVARWVGVRTCFATDFVSFAVCDRYFDISKARRVLGYEPSVQLKEGIERTMEWLDQEEKRKR